MSGVRIPIGMDHDEWVDLHERFADVLRNAGLRGEALDRGIEAAMKFALTVHNAMHSDEDATSHTLH